MTTISQSGQSPKKALFLLRRIHRDLSCEGIEDAWAEAELILCHATGLSKVDIYRDNPDISEDIIKTVNDMVRKRLSRVPLQYITGEVDFLKLNIKVGPGVLIPRPETEILVQEVYRLFKEGCLPPCPVILDMGTGSGCIGLAIARLIPSSHVIGVDISPRAIKYSSENKALNKIKNFHVLRGNLFEPVRDKTFALIVSNPPYVRTDEIASLQQEIAFYEPRIALDGGKDGLDYYRLIIPQSIDHLTKGGFLAFEIGIGQFEEIIRIAQRHGLALFRTKEDFSSIKRVLIFRRP
ncbi:MAG: peptide chain release factor N(5)-glutamine methyltransferase [Nitrospirae bacterium]|nr:peptide chain release factor N(5)-glutamine methyltransferase [Nitrospirota bacterium]